MSSELLHITKELITTLESYDNKGLHRVAAISGRHVTTIRALMRDWRKGVANPTLNTIIALWDAIEEVTAHAI